MRVLLIDDHEVVRAGLRTLLGRFPGLDVVGDASTGADGFEMARSLKPDVVLLDLRLPGEDGLQVCRRITTELPQVRVLILTSYSEHASVIESIQAGATGYLLKNADARAMVDAIFRVAAGEPVLDPAVMHAVFDRVQGKEPPASASGIAGELSPQELRVMVLVAEGRTNRQIAAEMGLTENTVKNYFRNVLAKLGLKRRAEAVAYFFRSRQNQSARES